MNLLDLPADILRNHIFHSPQLDNVSLAVCRFICKKIQKLINPIKIEKFIAEAAQQGYLSIVKWLRANGCPWNSWTCAYAAPGTGP